MLAEGALIATAGAAAGILFAFATQDLFNRFFQWRYDTTLIFLRITPAVVWQSMAIAVPLGIAASVVASWTLLRRQSSGAGRPLVLRTIRFAWLSLVRQPARSLLGICGVAAVGALLFDMLLLSRGLVVSFADLLEQSGFDIRVLASDAPPMTGPRLTGATALVSELSRLPGLEAVLQVRVREAELVHSEGLGETAPDVLRRSTSSAPTRVRVRCGR